MTQSNNWSFLVLIVVVYFSWVGLKFPFIFFKSNEVQGNYLHHPLNWEFNFMFHLSVPIFKFLNHKVRHQTWTCWWLFWVVRWGSCPPLI